MSAAQRLWDELKNLVKQQGTDGTAAVLIAGVADRSFSTRRKTALLILGFRHHVVDPEKFFVEQAYGAVTQCELCGMVCKVPREQNGGKAIQGRAVEFNCPSNGKAVA